MSDTREQWISARAYALWEEAGRPYGRDGEHWGRATIERERLELTRASHDGSEVLARKAASDKAARDAVAASGASVLVVEDEPAIRFDTLEALGHAGFKTYEAQCADEAMNVMNENRVTTLFTDVMMPGSMDGVGLATKVRSLWPKTQIIIASGLVRLAKKELVAGARFVQKPVAIPQLLELIGVHRKFA